MAVSHLDPSSLPGGAWFLLGGPPGTIQTAESFTEEQRAYVTTMRRFMDQEVLPNVERIERKDLPFLKGLLRKAGELGLLMVEIPEAYGGLELDVTTAMLVGAASTRLGSFSVTLGAQTGIGTLPILYFGNEAQKQKYLPKLGTAELISAYALTEPTSGSDALGAKTTAVLSPDGKTYRLNGSKQFITNAGIADLFIVFAKIVSRPAGDRGGAPEIEPEGGRARPTEGGKQGLEKSDSGQKFTAFIVDRDSPGLTVGPEEHKMGIRGSSTCPLTFEDCAVPAENVLGKIGKGHKIAFNVLNLGRLKLGVGSVGGSRDALAGATLYARDRKQFGKALTEFALIREKLARAAAAIYALESMAYRTTGLIDERLHREGKGDRIQAVEEYSIEASILKVMGSETLGQVIDEALQIHGGYGYIEGFDIERAYRDSRINRLYEGTNEINRMLVTGMLLKRALKGQLPLLEAMAALDTPLPAPASALGNERLQAEQLRRMALLSLQAGVEKFGPALEERQEILAAIADVVGEAFALESAVVRTLQVDPKSALRQALCALYAFDAVPRAAARARTALCCSKEGDELTAALRKLAELSTAPSPDPSALRETIVARMLERGGYPIGDSD